ncbi:MAG: hypothetical protein ACXVEF_01965 [Polyangiales bacterium]
MTPLPPSSQGSMPSSRTPTIGGRVQRDVRLQAALALVVGIAVVAIPLFLWGRGKKKGPDAAASASASAAQVDDAGPPAVIFGDAGASLAIDAGGRMVTFGEPHYLKCQDPGPTKTSPEKCDHLGAIEDVVTKTIAERVSACLPGLAQSTAVDIVVDVSFKKKKVRIKEGKEGSTMPVAQRKKLVACFDKGLTPPNFDQIAHAHQRYVFSFLATFGASASASAPQPATAPPPPPPIPAPITPQ